MLVQIDDFWINPDWVAIVMLTDGKPAIEFYNGEMHPVKTMTLEQVVKRLNGECVYVEPVKKGGVMNKRYVRFHAKYDIGVSHSVCAVSIHRALLDLLDAWQKENNKKIYDISIVREYKDYGNEVLIQSKGYYDE